MGPSFVNSATLSLSSSFRWAFSDFVKVSACFMPKDRPVSRVKTTNINPLSLPVWVFSILSWNAGVVFYVFLPFTFVKPSRSL